MCGHVAGRFPAHFWVFPPVFSPFHVFLRETQLVHGSSDRADSGGAGKPSKSCGTWGSRGRQNRLLWRSLTRPPGLSSVLSPYFFPPVFSPFHFMCSHASHTPCAVALIEPNPVALESPLESCDTWGSRGRQNRPSWRSLNHPPGISSTLSRYFFPPIFGATKTIGKCDRGNILCVFPRAATFDCEPRSRRSSWRWKAF